MVRRIEWRGGCPRAHGYEDQLDTNRRICWKVYKTPSWRASIPASMLH